MKSLWDALSFSQNSDPLKPALHLPGGSSLSYSELSEKTMAYGLASKSFDLKDRLVGVLSPKSFESVAVLLSILSSEGAYLPLDIGSPPDRIELIIEEAKLAYIWVYDDLSIEYADHLARWGFTKEVKCQGMSLWCRDGGERLHSDTAYVLFTSGSTGRPKGVKISHRNALAFIDWCQEEFALKETDVVTSIAPFHFDLSIFDLFASLKAGASVLLFDEKSIKNPRLLTSSMAEQGATVIYTTPTVLKLMVRYGKWSRITYEGLRLILFAGEAYPVDEWRKLYEVWPEVPMYNLYGPTETNVVTHTRVVLSDVEKRQEVPLGHVCSFADWKLEPTEELDGGGVRGRLWISGPSVAKGYLNREDLTNAVFLRDHDEVWYDTGDLVELGEDGVLLFRGRADRMTKRNGYRIELGEIEAATREYKGVVEAVALSVDTEGMTRIKLFIQMDKEVDDISEVMRSHLNSKLPAYMVPDDFEIIMEVPMTSNHKVDYIALRKKNDIDDTKRT